MPPPKDRSARIVTLGVGLLAVGVVAILVRLPARGSTGGFDFSAAEAVTDSPIPPLPLDSVLTTIPANPRAVATHLDRLSTTREAITRAEIAGIDGSTALDAVRTLRPYWLDPALRATVRAHQQLLGGPETLDAIRIDVVDSIRLVFSAEEPHWTVQVLLTRPH